MIISPYTRYYSTEELVAIADQLFLGAELGRIVDLKPETAWIVERAVRSYAARPSRDQIMESFCTVQNCNRSQCMNCMGKANAVMGMYEPWRD